MADYAHPEVLVSTDWLARHLEDPDIRILEVDWDPASAYELGHIPGAALVDWKRDINDPVRRDILSGEQFTGLMGRLGVTPRTTLVLYGDMRNWFAAFAFWTFRIHGHADIRLLNGGRRKWFEEDRPVTEAVPTFPPAQYPLPEPAAGLAIRSPPQPLTRSVRVLLHERSACRSLVSDPAWSCRRSWLSLWRRRKFNWRSDCARRGLLGKCNGRAKRDRQGKQGDTPESRQTDRLRRGKLCVHHVLF